MSYVPRAIVLYGEGINCEDESLIAVSNAGFCSRKVHVNALIEKKESLLEYDLLFIPGGFSYGDYLGSGKVLALKLKEHLEDVLKSFVSKGKPIVGVCNGFQVLLHLGLLGHPSRQKASLARNKSGYFECDWVKLGVSTINPSPWIEGLQNLKNLELPIRNGEGRFVSTLLDHDALVENNLVPALYYKHYDNGSFYNIAGVTDTSGLVFGLMPHPECFLDRKQYKTKTTEDLVLGQVFFDNIYNYLMKRYNNGH